MKKKILKYFFLTFLCITFLQSPILPQEKETANEDFPAANQSEAETNLIHYGDLIDVDVVGSYDYDWRGTIDSEGFISGISFIDDPILGLCRSEENVAEEIAKAYGKILREPKVVVKIIDRSNRPLSVIYGAVKTPQRFKIKRPVFLNELIVASGGITDKTSGEIQIFRPQKLNCSSELVKDDQSTVNSGETREKFVKTRQESNSQYINIRISDLLSGKKEANPQILSGDIITVQEAQPIYLIGAVANPKQIAINSQLTLSRAINIAGGFAKDAKLNKIIIYRRENSQTKIIEADFDKIKNDPTADPVLQAFDIVEVPQGNHEKSKFAPIIKTVEMPEKSADKLPLRIID